MFDTTMKQRVIVIGQGYTSRLCVIRSVAQLGCELYVIVMTGLQKDGKTLNTKKPIDCYSKYVHQVYYNKGNDSDGLINLLLTKCVKAGQKPLIITVGDFVTKVIDSHLTTLNNYFLFSHIHHRQGAIVEWMNKEKQKTLADKVGINITESCNIEIREGQFLIPQGINYPCFTKTREYLPGCKHTLKKCDSESTLIEFVGSMAKKFMNLTLLVEEFKNIETEYAVVGFSDGKQVVIPGIIKILSMAHGHHFGVACTGEVMPITGFEELITKFKRMILEIGYVGMFDIDFYCSESNFFFGELNLRMGGSGYAITKMGVNLPAMFVKSLLNEPINDMPHTIQQRATFVNERMWVGDWQKNYISTKEFYKVLYKTDISFVFDGKDQIPYKVFYWTIIVDFFKLVLKRIISRIYTLKRNIL